MYNANIKERYIEEKTSTTIIDKYFLPNLFKKSEEFELRLNKDVCNFTKMEIADMFKIFGFTSIESVRVNINGYALYTDWCMRQGFVDDSQNHFREIDVNYMSKLINVQVRQMKIVDREQTVEWMMALPNPSDQFIFLGMFEGIKGKDYKEFYELTGDDIDVDGHLINIYGRGKLQFSSMLCNIGIVSYKTEKFYPMGGAMERSGLFIPSNKVIKDFPNVKESVDDFRKGRRMYSRILRSMKYLGIDDYFDSNTLVNSGIIEMVRKESETLNMSKSEYVETHLNIINERFGKNYNKYSFTTKFGDYLG